MDFRFANHSEFARNDNKILTRAGRVTPCAPFSSYSITARSLLARVKRSLPNPAQLGSFVENGHQRCITAPRLRALWAYQRTEPHKELFDIKSAPRCGIPSHDEPDAEKYYLFSRNGNNDLREAGSPGEGLPKSFPVGRDQVFGVFDEVMPSC